MRMARGPSLRKSSPKNSTTSCTSSRAGSTSRRRSARSSRPARSRRGAWPRSSIATPGCRCSRSDRAPASSRARSWRAGVKPENLYLDRIFGRFRRATSRRSFRASTSSRATPSISTRRSATGAAWCSIRSFRACRCSTFRFPQRIALYRGPARPHPARAGRSCSSPTARCRRCRPAAATTRSSISISCCATFRRRSSGSIAARQRD